MIVRGNRRVRVKICCIQSFSEARTAIESGSAAVGLVSEMPSGPGVIPDARIAEIAAKVPPRILSVLLTSRTSAESIIEQHQRCRTRAIQLVDRLEHGSYSDLRDALPGIEVFQVIHVIGSKSVDEALAVAPEVDYLLLDSGSRDGEIKRLGGTGEVHDWLISKLICEKSGTPCFLAGGLTPENVAEAIRTVQPYGVDVCSGVRTDGKLDSEKLERFFSAVYG